MSIEDRRKPVHGGLTAALEPKDGVNADFAWSKNLQTPRMA